VEGNRLELAEPAGVHGLDDDEAPDRVELEAAGLREAQLVRVQACKLAHVSVQHARERGGRAWIQTARSEQGPERVEVRVHVGGDDLFGPHEHIVTPGSVTFAEALKEEHQLGRRQPHETYADDNLTKGAQPVLALWIIVLALIAFA